MDTDQTTEIGLVLELNAFKQLKLHWLYQGKPLSPYSSQIPQAFRSVTRSSQHYQSIEEELHSLLAYHPVEFDLFFRAPGKGIHRFHWDTHFNVMPATVFDLTEHVVTVKKAGVCAGQVIGDLFFIGSSFVGDPSTMKMIWPP